MAHGEDASPTEPIVAGPGSPAIAAVGTSLVVHEWTESGPSYLHVHRSDDEAWHVLEGSLRFRFADREVDAPAGTTVFVPAGVAHTYRVSTAERTVLRSPCRRNGPRLGSAMRPIPPAQCRIRPAWRAVRMDGTGCRRAIRRSSRGVRKIR